MKLFKNSDKRTVSSGLAISLGASIMLFAVLNISMILGWLSTAFSYISSVLWGLAIAYLMRPFSHFVEAKLPKRIKNPHTRNRLSATASLILLLLIIVLLIVIVVPQLVASVADFLSNFDSNLDSLKNTIKRVAHGISFIEVSDESIDQFIGSSEELLKTAVQWLQSNIDRVLSILGNVANVIVNFVIVISMAAYALFDMKNIKRNLKRVEKALLGEEKTANLNVTLSKGDALMTNFLTSNIIDALIIGVANFIFLTIVDAPYTLILSVLLGVTNFVPTFGPIAGGIVGGLIIVLTDSPLLLPFIIFTLILQQIDGNVLKPLLFGDSTGLSGFWVLVAILVGGKLFGIIGMILGVPVVAFAATLLDESLKRINGDNDLPMPEKPKRKFSITRLFRRKKEAAKG